MRRRVQVCVRRQRKWRGKRESVCVCDIRKQSGLPILCIVIMCACASLRESTCPNLCVCLCVCVCVGMWIHVLAGTKHMGLDGGGRVELSDYLPSVVKGQIIGCLGQELSNRQQIHICTPHK